MIYNLTKDELTTPIFKFQEWFDDGRDFLSRLEELRNNVLEEDSLTARLNLVKFFLGHQMTKEASSYLEYIGDYDQSYHNNYNFKSLYVAALYLTQNYHHALIEAEKISISN